MRPTPQDTSLSLLGGWWSFPSDQLFSLMSRDTLVHHHSSHWISLCPPHMDTTDSKTCLLKTSQPTLSLHHWGAEPPSFPRRLRGVYRSLTVTPPFCQASLPQSLGSLACLRGSFSLLLLLFFHVLLLEVCDAGHLILIRMANVKAHVAAGEAAEVQRWRQGDEPEAGCRCTSGPGPFAPHSPLATLTLLAARMSA